MVVMCVYMYGVLHVAVVVWYAAIILGFESCHIPAFLNDDMIKNCPAMEGFE